MAFYLMYIFLIFGRDGLSLIITCKGMELRKRCDVWHDFGHTKFSLRLLELVFLDILKHGGGSSVMWKLWQNLKKICKPRTKAVYS